MSKALKALRARSTELRTKIDGLTLDDAGELRALTAEETTEFEAITADLAGVETRMTAAVDAEKRQRGFDQALKDLGVDDEVHEEPLEQRNRPGATATDKRGTYEKGGDYSYLQDIFAAKVEDSSEARSRLQRHGKEMAGLEKRASSRVDGLGGHLVPPVWMMDDFAALARPGRVTADLVPGRALPTKTDTINLPRLTQGGAVAAQAGDNTPINSQDINDAIASGSVITIAGQIPFAQQLLDQSPLNFDDIAIADLAADYAQKLNTGVVGNSTLFTNNLYNIVPAGNQVTYTSGTPTGPAVYSKILDAIQRVSTSRFWPAEAIVMHPRRWFWLAAQTDTAGRPLVVPDQTAYNPLGVYGPIDPFTPMGRIAGLPVFADPTIATNLGAGTNQDTIFVCRFSDLRLYEGEVRTRVLEQTLGQQLTLVAQLWRYAALIPGRYPNSVARIDGTGLVTPTF